MIKNYQEPFDLFNKWLDLAKAKAKNFDAVTIATANTENQPSLEMGLLEEFSPNGFKIISDSKKIIQNSKIAICIYWPELGYQIRIEGMIEDVMEDKIKIEAKAIEFWSDGQYRFHNRSLYTKLDSKQGWKLEKLYP